MRCEGRDQLDQRHHLVAMHRTLAGAQHVHVLHHRGDRGVVAECGDVFGHLADRRVQLAHHRRVSGASGDTFVHGTPDAIEEAAHAGDAAVAIVAAFLILAEEHEVGAQRISAPALDQLVGVDDVAFRLRHLGAFANDHAMGTEARERLLEVEEAAVVEHHRDEARIQEVQYGVLVAADVGRDRQPLRRQLAIEGDVAAVGARVAQEVPGAVEEVVADVGLASAHRAAGGAGHAIPLVVAGQRRDAAVVGTEVLDQRQHHRQLGFGNRYRAAAVAVDDRDRRPPVPLARDAPVVQPVVHHGRRTPALLEPGDDGLLRLGHRHARELRRIHEQVGVGLGRVGFGERHAAVVIGAGHHTHDRQRELLRELEVAFVVARHAHHGAGAVLHQHVVGDPDRNRLSGGRIDRFGTGEDACLLLVHLP